jgi:hypothetical protein
MPFSMLMDTLLTDLRRSLRSFVRAQGLSFPVITTLGLAMGANIAVLALIDRLVLRPLPVEKPSEVVLVSAPPLPSTGPGFSVGTRTQRLDGQSSD